MRGAVASPDDTTIPGEDFIDTLAPAPPMAPAVDLRMVSDAPDRLVFFFSGFDPKSASFYHRLFRNGIAQRNAAHDETLALGKKHRIGRWASVWTSLWRGPAAVLGGRPVTMRTRVHFMRWDDIVRRHWRRTPLTLLSDYWNVYAGGLSSGVLARIWRAAPAAFWMAMFPLIVGVLALGAGMAIVGGLLAFSGWLSLPVSLTLGLLVGALAWRITARWVDCEWLLRLYAFMRQQAIGEVPALDARLDEMATRLVDSVEARMRHPGAAPLKEILVIGYSSGTVMAASVLARAMPKLADVVDSRRTNKGTTLGARHAGPVHSHRGGMARRTAIPARAGHARGEPDAHVARLFGARRPCGVLEVASVARARAAEGSPDVAAVPDGAWRHAVRGDASRSARGASAVPAGAAGAQRRRRL